MLKMPLKAQYLIIIKEMNTKAKNLPIEIEKIINEFVSITSHQLRTPLSSIKWTIEFLLENEKKNLNRRQKELLKRISESNENMIRLINDLLNVSCIEYGKIIPKIQKIETVALIKKTLNEITPNVKKKKQILKTLGLNKKLIIYSDPNLLKQILQNLLSNATKYTHETGIISIELKDCNEEHFMIIIADNGLGIPNSEKHRLFQKFFRAVNVILKETEGTGLGLYLVKSMIELLEGKVWFQSKMGKGSTFYLKIPKKTKIKKK